MGAQSTVQGEIITVGEMFLRFSGNPCRVQQEIIIQKTNVLFSLLRKSEIIDRQQECTQRLSTAVGIICAVG
jgi:hypothetical protein